MKIKKYLVGAVVLFVCCWCLSCTGGHEDSASGLAPLEVHNEVLTVDTHCDTPMIMSRDWDMGVRHEPSPRGGKIDLPP